MTEAIFGFAGVFVGALVNGIFAYFSDKRREKHLGIFREEESHRTRMRERAEFDRENILQLQEVIAEKFRTEIEFVFHELKEFKRTGTLGIVPNEIGERGMLASRRIRFFTQRITDEQIRNEIENGFAAIQEIQSNRYRSRSTLQEASFREDLDQLQKHMYQIDSIITLELRRVIEAWI